MLNTRRFEIAIERTMTAQATVYRKAQVADSTGGFTDTFTVAFTSKCFYYRADIMPLERESTFTVQSVVLWNFGFPARTEILVTDRIVVGTRTFEVLSSASGSFELAARVLCREIL